MSHVYKIAATRERYIAARVLAVKKGSSPDILPLGAAMSGRSAPAERDAWRFQDREPELEPVQQRPKPHRDSGAPDGSGRASGERPDDGQDEIQGRADDHRAQATTRRAKGVQT